MQDMTITKHVCVYSRSSDFADIFSTFPPKQKANRKIKRVLMKKEIFFKYTQLYKKKKKPQISCVMIK